MREAAERKAEADRQQKERKKSRAKRMKVSSGLSAMSAWKS